jgi:hypothetical protein
VTTLANEAPVGCERPDTFSDVLGERPERGSVRQDVPPRERVDRTPPDQIPPVPPGLVTAIAELHKLPDRVKGAAGEQIAETLAPQIAFALRGECVARAGVNPGPNGVDLLIETESGHVIAVEVKRTRTSRPQTFAARCLRRATATSKAA